MTREPVLRVVSWNVNGLRACARQGFARWLGRSGAGVVGVQEVRACASDLPENLRAPRGWHVALVEAERRGYSGVGIFSREPPDEIESALGIAGFDVEGRYQMARFGRLAVLNAYFPKGSGPLRDNSRVPYKLAFYRAVFERAEALRKRRLRVLVVGDFNTAHTEIDLARPRDNARTSGFLPEERAELDRWIAAGWVDAFRARHPGETGHYTWWKQWGGAREKNVGWRIDFALCSPSAMPFVRDAFVWPHVRGSDHCPVGLDLDPTILRVAAERKR